MAAAAAATTVVMACDVGAEKAKEKRGGINRRNIIENESVSKSGVWRRHEKVISERKWRKAAKRKRNGEIMAFERKKHQKINKALVAASKASKTTSKSMPLNVCLAPVGANAVCGRRNGRQTYVNDHKQHISSGDSGEAKKGRSEEDESIRILVWLIWPC